MRRGELFNVPRYLAAGQLVFHMFGALAEFERNLIRERTMAGLKAARARKLTAKDLKTVRALLRSGHVPVGTIAEQAHVARSMLYRNCRDQRLASLFSLSSSHPQ
jgi:DNA invertase Pin-like site-specific DNA recombinase